MNCLESQEQIQHYLDGEQADKGQDEFAAHLLLCPECREQFAAAQYLLEGLRLLAPARPPAGSGKRIYRQIMLEFGRARRVRRITTACAVAACLLLASWVGYRASSAHRAAPGAAFAVAEPRSFGSAAGMGDPSPTVAAQKLPRSVKQEPVEVEKALGQALERSAQSFQVIQKEMFASLEPVTLSARQALNFFLRGVSPLENNVQ